MIAMTRYGRVAVALACATSVTLSADAQKPARHSTASAATIEAPSVVLGSVFNARSIGPAVMGGRVSSLAWNPEEPTTFYIGQGMAGVFKTTDGGSTFHSIFDQDGIASIGDIAVAPSDPKVVWVGTGEANDRNSETWGSGVYRSTDAGKSWTHVGLAESRVIARVAVNPTDPSMAYVAVVGDLWQPSAERGVYKTTDAGATWHKVLGAAAPYDTKVGAGDVVIDPSNPSVVYAALYARERRPWLFSAGPRATEGHDLGGIFKSDNGGTTWRKLSSGLPTQTGRIGLSIYPKNPKILYAVIQSDDGGMQSPLGSFSTSGGVFRSDDGGEHWERKNGLDSRAFYFSQIRVDPSDDRRVYDLGMPLYVSNDSGRTWHENVSEHVHPDLHALLIDPANRDHLILGTDGGVYQSFSAGATWTFLNQNPAGEFRRINTDNRNAGRVCGGLQDNGLWVGLTRSRNSGGIQNANWMMAGDGDGGYCLFDPTDSNILYWSMQQQVYRTNLTSGETTELRPTASEDWPLYHYNWVTPLVGSPHDTGALYLGSNVVFRLTDHGRRWTAISPDLTSGKHQTTLSSTSRYGDGWADYGTSTDIAASPVTAGVIWAGTDDGKLWRTADNGAHWTDLSAKLPVAARDHWIDRIEPGHRSAQAAYVAIDGHRDGVDAPLAYRTDDGGQTWQSISSTLPRNEPVRVVREDPDNPDVLYAGTERHLWLSLDRGNSWMPLGHLPPVAVEDIAIHPINHDLIIATQGLSLYVIDQARPLAQLTPTILADVAYLFVPEPASHYDRLPGGETDGSEFRGADAPRGSVLTYYVKRDLEQPVRIAITTVTGEPITTLTRPAMIGMNRIVWNLEPGTGLFVGSPGAEPPKVPPGVYRATLTYGPITQTQTLTVASP